MIRFSPTSGTTSASVPIAATLTNAGSHDEPARFRAERLHQFEGDADTGEVLVRIAAVVSLRVDDGDGPRQRGVRLVVVGDDQVDAERARVVGRFGGPDAAVDGDDEPGAVRVQTFDCRRLQAVSVAQTFRNEVHDVGAEQFERSTQDHGRRHAIDVVVAMDGDAFLAGDGAEDAFDGLAHVGQQKRIVQIGERRRQEALCRGRVRQVADAQQSRGGGTDAQLARQFGALSIVTRTGLPDTGSHRCSRF